MTISKRRNGGDFGNQTITQYDLNASVNGINWTGSLSGTSLISAFANSSTGGIPLSGTCTPCLPGPIIGTANGALTGTQAQGIATSYKLQTLTGNLSIGGVAALKRQ